MIIVGTNQYTCWLNSDIESLLKITSSLKNKSEDKIDNNKQQQQKQRRLGLTRMRSSSLIKPKGLNKLHEEDSNAVIINNNNNNNECQSIISEENENDKSI